MHKRCRFSNPSPTSNHYNLAEPTMKFSLLQRHPTSLAKMPKQHTTINQPILHNSKAHQFRETTKATIQATNSVSKEENS
jgi:hypothetical protein